MPAWSNDRTLWGLAWGDAGWSPVAGPIFMAKQSKNTRGMKAAKPGRHRQGDGCDTGRLRYPNKAAAGPNAEQCGRCKGWHAKDDRPHSRAGRRTRENPR